MDGGFVYHQDCNKYDLEIDHPLIGNKLKKTKYYLVEKGIMNDLEVFTPERDTDEYILKVHKAIYVDKLKRYVDWF